MLVGELDLSLQVSIHYQAFVAALVSHWKRLSRIVPRACVQVVDDNGGGLLAGGVESVAAF